MGDERSKTGRRVVTSFVVRFVSESGQIELEPETPLQPEQDERLNGWRGVIQHIQTGSELHFSRLEEAEAFMLKHLLT